MDPMNESVIFVHKDAYGQPDYVVNLVLTYVQEEDMWVGICQELNTSAYAETLPETKHQLKEAILLQLNEVERLGYIADYLSDNHISTMHLDGGTKEASGFALAESMG